MAKGLKRIAAVVMAAVMLFAMLPYGLAADTKQGGRTVRVAYPIQAGLTERDETGNYSGYTYEYLQEVAQYTGWQYEFVEVPGDIDNSLTTLLDMLQKGEVDLMGGMLFSEELNSLYDYSGHSYGTVKTVLQVPHNQPDSIVIDAQQEQQLTVAVYGKSVQRRQELEEYAKINLLHVSYVECETEDELIDAVLSGRADAMINTSLNAMPGMRTIAEFAPKPFYFVLSKQAEPGLMQELNAAIMSIQQIDPYFTISLQEKYFTPKNEDLLLTDEEEQYIRTTGAIRVAVRTDEPPFQYRNAEDGSTTGLAPALLQYIGEQTGLTFELVPVSTESGLMELARDGKVDMVAGMTYNYTLARENGVSMTHAYASSQYVLLMRQDWDGSMEGKTLAVPEGTLHSFAYDGKTQFYDSFEDCIRAVSKGEADFTYADGYAAQYYLNQSALGNLRMVPQTDEPREICFGVAMPGHKQLLSIMNKALLVIPEEELRAMVYRNTVTYRRTTLWSFMKEHPAESVLFVMLFCGLVVALLGFNLVQRVRSEKKNALELKKRLQIYQLTQEYFFEYDNATQTLLVSNPNDTGDGESEALLRYDYRTSASSTWSQEDRDKFRSFLEEGKDGTHELRMGGIDGQQHWLRIVQQALRDEAGKPVGMIGKINVIDEEKREKDLLRQRAERDGLTGVFHAAAVRQLVGEYLSEMPDGQHGALLLLDVDHFKEVNDNYGHLQGDEALQQVAAMLQRSFRDCDVVGRSGGDEFVVYMHRLKHRDALRQKCALLTREAHDIVMPDGASLTISLGASLTNSGQSFNEVYTEADKALYAAKAAGRDCYRLSDEEK